ncbi:putative M-phase phosphoprotein [Helianthus debilis subsp. tardiflorus]
MAKRELSSTLKNLKFIQRGAKKEENTKKEEEVIPDGNFGSYITKKCMVIMEGDPSPGAIKGRMSFQSFNPSIDKLNEEASNPRQSDGDATSSGDQGGKPSNRDYGESVSLNNNKTNGDLKRKQAEATTYVQLTNKSENIIEGNTGSSSNNSRKKSHKRGKLDFNVLRSPKSQNRTG